MEKQTLRAEPQTEGCCLRKHRLIRAPSHTTSNLEGTGRRLCVCVCVGVCGGWGVGLWWVCVGVLLFCVCVCVWPACAWASPHQQTAEQTPGWQGGLVSVTAFTFSFLFFFSFST